MKAWYRSRTIWFNVLTMLPLMLDAVAANMGLLQPVLPAKWYPLVAAIVGIGNLWLRIITKEALKKHDQPDQGSKP